MNQSASSSTEATVPEVDLVCRNPECDEQNVPYPRVFVKEMSEGLFCPLCNKPVYPVGSEEQRTAEVDEVLASAGVTREQVSTASDSGENDPMAVLQEAQNGGPRIQPTVQAPIVNAVLDSFYGTPSAVSDVERRKEAGIAADANAGDAARATASDLVPEMGSVLAKREPTALAYGYPPAVDALIVKAKLSPEQTNELLGKFSELFKQITGWRSRLNAIKISGPDDEREIAEAKELFEAIRDDRLNSTKRKQIIKEPYLRPSQLIDGVFKVYTDEAGPLEKEALAKAKTKELAEAAKHEAVRVERQSKLEPFVENVKVFNLYPFNMTDEAFDQLLDSSKQAHMAREDQERREKEERERIEDEAAAERVKLRRQTNRRMELSSLGFTRDEDNKRFTLEDLTVYDVDVDGENDATWMHRIVALKPKADEIRVEQKRKKDEADKLIADKAEGDRLANDTQAREAREREAAQLAPDKIKLTRLAESIDAIAFFETSNEKINDILGEVRGGLTAVTAKLRSQIKQLP